MRGIDSQDSCDDIHGKRSLVIAGETALSQLDSGARQRLDSIVALLEEADYTVTVSSREGVREPDQAWSLCVGMSWPTALALRHASKFSRRTWFDACDSTKLLRSSLTAVFPVRSRLAGTRDRLACRLLHPDLVTYITATDAQADADLWRSRPWVLPITWRTVSTAPPNFPRRLVFVGDGKYAPNRQAVLWIIGTLVPTLRSMGHTNEVVVYGDGYDDLAWGGVSFRGYVAEERDIYTESDIHIAPVVHGAGMKSKVVVPALAGIRVVTTKCGAQGLRRVPAIEVSSLQDFPATVAGVLNDPGEPLRAVALEDLLSDDDTTVIREWLESGDDARHA